MPDSPSVRWRVTHLYLPYIVLAIGLGVALLLVNNRASSGELSAERRDRLSEDCRSRVEARDVLRDVITQAYQPSSNNPAVTGFFAARRSALLARVPTLHCETKDGIPIPVPNTDQPE